MKNLFLIYWVITTIISIYWLIKNPRYYDDKKYFTVIEVIAKIFPSIFLGWFFVPFIFLASIKFKR